MNNFKELQKMQEEAYRQNVNKLKSNIDSNMDVFSALSNLIEVYFSRFMEFFIDRAGGSVDEEKP